MANKNPDQSGLKKIRTTKEARKRGANGGKKSGEVRRQKKTMKEMLDYLLQQDITNKQGETKNTLEVMMTAQIKEAIKGNTKAAQFVRDTIGEMPTQKIDFGEVPIIQDDIK